MYPTVTDMARYRSLFDELADNQRSGPEEGFIANSVVLHINWRLIASSALDEEPLSVRVLVAAMAQTRFRALSRAPHRVLAACSADCVGP